MNEPIRSFTLGKRLQIAASLLAPFAVLWLLSRKHWLPLPSNWVLIAALAAFLTGVAFPRAFAGWHRVLSDVQSWIGRRIVMLLLAIVFVLVVAPFGIILRLCGKSFLELRPADSYWKKIRPSRSLRDQF